MEKHFLIFDSHAHYDDSKYDGIRDDALAFAQNNGVGAIINCGCDISSSAASVALAEKYDFIYAAAGYHPECVNASTVFEEEKLEHLIRHPKVVAVGEIGLDYYWSDEYKIKQLDFFEKQLNFAATHSLPVIIHDRAAHADSLSLIKKYKPAGVVHCFSGSAEMAQEIVSIGMYIGVGGVLTFKNSKKLAEVVRKIPPDRILLETDAPYMAPEPFRGETNNSSYIRYVAEKIAEIKDISTDEVLEKTYNNACSLFNISK